MFNPTEIIFSVTTSCNLHCPHCFVSRKPASLKAEDAINFLKSTRESENSQIEKVGFSGGEPFLNLDFLYKVIKSAIDLDFMFDRIMTNGDWWKTKEDLLETLKKIYDAGYDGKIGLSYDNFHAQSEERVSVFIQAVWDVFGSDAIEIQSVTGEVSPSLQPPRLPSSGEPFSATPSTGVGSAPTCGDKTCETGFERVSVTAVPEPCPPYPLSSTERLKALSSKLKLSYEENISDSGRGIASLSDSEHFLPAYIQLESFQSTDKRAFKDKEWFEDDFCEGPGQILFVHTSGDIAPCCGFANENKELFIGKITDSFDEVLKKAGENKMVRLCYEEGLSKQIGILKEQKKLPEGKTSDICTFCDFVCKLANINSAL